MELIETMLVTNGNIKNFSYHLERVKKAYKYFKWKFDEKEWVIKLTSSRFQVPGSKFQVSNDKFRLRITYSYNGIKNIEVFPIKKRSFKKFKVININYNYFIKKKNRKFFTLHFSLFPSFDEFILIKNGLVTDTTISNLAFFDGIEWLTPKYPLLRGTKREELLNKGILKEENIHKFDLPYFKKIALINAILEFYVIDEFDIII
ncbi:aminotransferase class IV family protein [Caminibacter profundus]